MLLGRQSASCWPRTLIGWTLLGPFGQLKQRLGVPPTTRLYTRAETRTHTVTFSPILAHKNTFWDTHWRALVTLATRLTMYRL